MQVFTWTHVLFIVTAARWTLLLSLIAFAFGGLAGILVTIARVQPAWAALRYVAIGYIGLFQSTPLLMQLFLIYFGVGFLGFPLDAWTAVTIAFTLHVSAFLADIWRGCLEAIPKGQSEAATALSLSYMQRLRLVLAPQAIRIAIAPSVGFLVQVIKGTSLAAIIGFIEIMRTAQMVSNATLQPMLVYSIVIALYFVICWPLSLFSRHLERKLATPHSAAVMERPAVLTGTSA